MSFLKKAFALTLLTAVPIVGYSNCSGPEMWSGTLNGNWDATANWSPNTCVPGSGAASNTDSATFGSVVGASSAISLDAVPIDPGLGQLIFNNATTTFTINSTTHFLQFNGTNSSLEVLAGSHVLNTFVHVNNTLLNITVNDGLLTLQKAFTETAGSTSSINFNGSGPLLNEMNSVAINGNLSVASGILTNNNTAAVVAGEGSLIQLGGNFLLSGGSFTNSNSGPISVGAVGSAISAENFMMNGGSATGVNTGAINGGNGSFLGAINGTINGGSLTLQNSGPISNAGAGNFFSLTNLTINGGSVLNTNSGPVTGNVSVGSFISVLTDLSLNGGTLTNTNTGVVSSQGIGSLIEAQAAITINGGTLINNDTVWTPSLNIGRAGTVAGSGVFQNIGGAATTQVTNAGMVIPGGPKLGGAPGAMTIQGSYSQTGTLGVSILNSSSFSQLIVTGTAQLGGTLEAAFSPGSRVIPGETFSIVQANGGVSGTFSNLINFNIPNLALQVRYLPTSVLLSFTPAANRYPNYFETLFASNNHINQRLERQMSQLRNRFYERTEKAMPQSKSKTFYFMAEQPAAIEITPISNAVHSTVQIEKQQLAFYRYQPTEEKQEQLRRNISRPESSIEEHLWNFYLGPTGDIGHVLTKKDATGFNYWSAGVLTGFDYAFSEVGAGLLMNYDHLRGNAAHHWGKFDINHAQANFYATYSPDSRPEFAANAIVGGGYNWIEVRRNAGIDEIPAVAKGSPRGGEFDTLVGLEYALDNRKVCAMPDDLQIVPLVSLQYTYLYAKKYREHGAGLFDLKFTHQAAKSLRSTLGARLNYTWHWTDVEFTPEFNVGWQREFLDKGRSLGFTPIDFTVPSTSLKIPRSGRNVAMAGVDFLVTLFDKYGIEASYEFEWNSLYHDQFFYVGCNFRF